MSDQSPIVAIKPDTCFTILCAGSPSKVAEPDTQQDDLTTSPSPSSPQPSSATSQPKYKDRTIQPASDSQQLKLKVFLNNRTVSSMQGIACGDICKVDCLHQNLICTWCKTDIETYVRLSKSLVIEVVFLFDLREMDTNFRAVCFYPPEGSTYQGIFTCMTFSFICPGLPGSGVCQAQPIMLSVWITRWEELLYIPICISGGTVVWYGGGVHQCWNAGGGWPLGDSSRHQGVCPCQPVAADNCRGFPQRETCR